jgi:hypothetical protein
MSSSTQGSTPGSERVSGATAGFSADFAAAAGSIGSEKEATSATTPTKDSARSIAATPTLRDI